MQEEELQRLREENARLREELRRLGQGRPEEHAAGAPPAPPAADGAAPRPAWDGTQHGLTKEQIARYSRQIILQSFGVHGARALALRALCSLATRHMPSLSRSIPMPDPPARLAPPPAAQARLCNGSVLIVGAGGLGSPAALYLAAAGVGRIGIVDRDSVELSNIHRQVIHSEASVGAHKALSAAAACRALNSGIAVEAHLDGFAPANAVDLVDACCVARRPLVSGAAIGTDGQLTVYCYGKDGPCYRCLFPEAPRPESCARCVDAGVLGPVPGAVGTLQAVEALKILAGVGEPMSRKLLLLDLLSSRFHTVRLRARSPSCVACGDRPAITAATLPAYDYAGYTGQRPTDAAPALLSLVPPEQRLSPAQLHAALAGGAPAVLLDVRPSEQFAICHLPGAVHAPYRALEAHVPLIRQALEVAAAGGGGAAAGSAAGGGGGAAGGGGEAPPALYVVCRRGNDSQRAVVRLRELGLGQATDVVGGMEAWAREVDPGFPRY
eukprot:scaffold14.g1231.t1